MDILKAIMADPNVSGDLKRVLGAPNADQALALRRAEYAAALGRFNWQFEHSSDQRIWKSGTTELSRLRDERAAIDPQGVTWDKFAPEGYRYSRVLA